MRDRKDGSLVALARSERVDAILSGGRYLIDGATSSDQLFASEH